MTTKIDPITAVQDSIDSLALSLFEALRGVRDAVAPQSLSAAPVATSNKEDVEPITSENARGELKQILPEGVEIPSEYLSRAFDLLEPDYYAFFLAYLSGDEYSRELVERFRALSDASAAPAKGVSGTSSELTNSANPLISQEESHSSEVELGNVGYKFRKLFDAGWFDGKVIEIRPLAGGLLCYQKFNCLIFFTAHFITFFLSLMMTSTFTHVINEFFVRGWKRQESTLH